MKKHVYYSLIILVPILAGCIGQDINEDWVPAELKISNPLLTITVGQSYDMQYRYTDNVGMMSAADVIWRSTNENVLSVNSEGQISAHSPGNAAIIATLVDNADITVSDFIEVLELVSGEPVDNPVGEVGDRLGTVNSTSSYLLEGDFTMSESSTGLVLEFADNYIADSGLPGLYVYLTNNPNTNSGAYEIGPVTQFEGAHVYTIDDSEIELNMYDYVLFYCKPFTVKVGHGEFNEQ